MLAIITKMTLTQVSSINLSIHMYVLMGQSPVLLLEHKYPPPTLYFLFFLIQVPDGGSNPSGP